MPPEADLPWALGQASTHVRNFPDFFKGNAFRHSTAFRDDAGAGTIHQNAPHQSPYVRRVKTLLRCPSSEVQVITLNRNSRDFDDPKVRGRLEALHCKFFPKFTPTLAYVSSRILRPPI